MAIVESVREPDLAIGDDGGGPAFAGDGGLPLDVLFFAPLERQALGVGVAILLRAAELGPGVAGLQGGGREQCEEGAIGGHGEG